MKELDGPQRTAGSGASWWSTVAAAGAAGPHEVVVDEPLGPG